MSNKIKLSAQRFASKGFKVFPRYGNINPKNWVGKDKDEEGNLLDGWIDGKFYCPSSTDVNKIAEWPESLYDKPLSGYGINPQQRAIIIDVDNYDKKAEVITNQGTESLNKLVDIFGINIQDAVKVNSKSPGCYHLYFKYPSNVTNGEWIKSSTSPEINGKKFNCVDIRADRAFVAGPTPDGPYTLASDDFKKLDALPGLPESFTSCFHVKPNDSGMKAQADDDSKIPAGGRDDYMFRQMCKLKGLGLSLSRAKAVISAEFDRLEQPKGNEISLDHFIARLEEIYDDTNYNANPFQVKLADYLENFVHIKSPFGVFNFKTMDFSKPDAAKSIYSHIITMETVNASGEAKTVDVDVFNKWVKNNDRIIADGLGFNPSAHQIYDDITSTGKERTLVNTYVKPSHKLIEYSKEDKYIRMWEFLSEYIWEENVDYALKWCASIIRHPQNKIQHMLMLISELHGLGKDAFFLGLSKVIGEHNTRIIQLENLEEKFNSYLQDNILILINESNKLSDSKVDAVRSKLKFYVTGDRVPIRRMGTDVEMHKTYSNFMLYGNSTKIMAIEDEDNRIFPHINTKREPLPESFTREYFSALKDPEFTNAIYSYMMDVDLSDFKFYSRAPVSKDRQQLIFDNKSAVEKQIITWIEEEFGIFKFDIISRDSFEFMLNEMFNFSFAKQDKAAYLDNLWRSFIKNCEPIKKTVRMQKIMKRSGPNDIVKVTKSTTPCKLYALKNGDMYNQVQDNSVLIRQIFMGIAEVEPLVQSAQNLKPEVKDKLREEQR